MSANYSDTSRKPVANVPPNEQSAVLTRTAQEDYIGDGDVEPQNNTGSSASSHDIEKVAAVVVRGLLADERFKVDVAKHVAGIQGTEQNMVLATLEEQSITLGDQGFETFFMLLREV